MLPAVVLNIAVKINIAARAEFWGPLKKGKAAWNK